MRDKHCGRHICRLLIVTGTVQGVGFRPYVYKLARSCKLGGMVYNSGRGVVIEVEGENSQVETFINTLRNNPPPLARIEEFFVAQKETRGYMEFSITATGGAATAESVVPPDTATCPDCRRETMDPADRHYRYPFTNCTNCGPRFTIVARLPYDRPFTSMAAFKMCRECEAEYCDPSDRRFHAQPVACPFCGPRVWLTDREGKEIAGDWLLNARQMLAEGKIIALKSLGGFHLACDAGNPAAVVTLRSRKRRPAKPLAIMCRDMSVVREHCHLSAIEEALLTSPAAPVMILEKKRSSTLPGAISPKLGSLGVMLPYTPLHLLLMRESPPVLVMTSGNGSGLPLAVENRQALTELGHIADYFLLHDREVVNRCDDSVLRVVAGKPQFFRRSRGYVPSPLGVPVPGGTDVGKVFLGAGGDMKNTFCLLKSGLAYMGQHTGSLDTREGLGNYRVCLEHFCRMLGVQPAVVGYDPHPEYHVSRLVQKTFLEKVEVWHHHAHMASCMGENGLDEKVIGVILDGTGYGRDGNIWGFEVLLGDYAGFTREYHLEYLPLPGGDRAVRNPWITAVAWLIAGLGQDGPELAVKFFPGRERETSLLIKMIEQNINLSLVSSCGRMFDAVSALLGVCFENTYDGQAAVELGELAPAVFKTASEHYPFEFDGRIIRTGAIAKNLVADLLGGVAREDIARKFHNTVVSAVSAAAERVRLDNGVNKVVMSGGSWHNPYLLQGVTATLRKNNFEVFCHHRVPPGDGGIALGQALVASAVTPGLRCRIAKKRATGRASLK